MVGALEGGLTQGLNNAVADDRFWNGVGKGAAIGGAFGLVTSGQFGNTLKGQVWRSDQAVFERFKKAGDMQGAVDYFGGNGTWNPDYPKFQANPDAAAHTQWDGDIIYGGVEYSSVDNFKLDIFHELKHQKDIFSGAISRSEYLSLEDNFAKAAYIAKFEHASYLTSYRNQELFSQHSRSPVDKI